MADRFNSTQLSVIDQDNRNMAFAGYRMGDEINDIWAAIDTGPVGIEASSADIDSVALGGGNFTRDKDTADGSTLLFAWEASRFHNGLSLVNVSSGSLTLSASATNYVEVDRSGSVSSNTSGFTSGRLPLWIIGTGPSSYSDDDVASAKPFLTLIGTAGVLGSMLSTPGSTKEIGVDLGDVSATVTDFPILLPAVAGKVVGISILSTAAISADDTNYWKYKLVNKGPSGSGTTVVVDDTVGANSTKATGGSAQTAFVKRQLTLSGTPSNLNTASEDCLALTITKTASAVTMTKFKVRVDVQFTA